MDADGSCSGSCGGLGWAPPVEIESCSRHHSSAQLSSAAWGSRSSMLNTDNGSRHCTDTAQPHPQQHHSSQQYHSTAAILCIHSLINIYTQCLQISTLHLVNTYSVRRYLHSTVHPTSSSCMQLSPWRQRRASLQVCSMHLGGGWGPPYPAPKEGQVFLSELCIPRVGQMGSIQWT